MFVNLLSEQTTKKVKAKQNNKAMVIRVYHIFKSLSLYTNLIYKKQKVYKNIVSCKPDRDYGNHILSFLSKRLLGNFKFKIQTRLLENCNFVIHYYLDKYA